MATPDHTPSGRGYSTALHYFHHDNDYWNDKVGGCGWDGHKWSVEVVDLWQTNIDAPNTQGPANQYNNTCPGNLPNVNDDHDRLGQSCIKCRLILSTLPRGDPRLSCYYRSVAY